MTMSRRVVLPALAALLLSACASLPNSDPLQVTVAGIEPMQGEGLELRMLVKLRVQNPNDAQIDYNGVYVKLDVQGRTFASGVSDEAGSVPRFGETVIGVPVTVSVLRMVRQVMGVLDGKPVSTIHYAMSGKLNGSAFRSVRFESQGEIAMPTSEPSTSTEGSPQT
jgi:LEA14-like dessication related protein